MSDFIKRTDAVEAVWRVLNGMGISQKHNERLVEEVDAVVDDIPAADVRPVVLCGVCELHGHCYTEDVFAFARLAEGNRFCAVGKVKKNGKKREES